MKGWWDGGGGVRWKMGELGVRGLIRGAGGGGREGVREGTSVSVLQHLGIQHEGVVGWRRGHKMEDGSVRSKGVDKGGGGGGREGVREGTSVSVLQHLGNLHQTGGGMTGRGGGKVWGGGVQGDNGGGHKKEDMSVRSKGVDKEGGRGGRKGTSVSILQYLGNLHQKGGGQERNICEYPAVSWKPASKGGGGGTGRGGGRGVGGRVLMEGGHKMEEDESVRSKGVEVVGGGGGRGHLWVSCSILEACIEGAVGQQGGKGEGEGGGVGGGDTG